MKMVVPDESAQEQSLERLTELVEMTRTGVTPEVLAAEGRPFDDILHDSSTGADLVLMGMAEPDGDFLQYFTELRERTTGLPPTVFVLAAEEIAFREVLLRGE